jgi:hypothetical protein
VGPDVVDGPKGLVMGVVKQECYTVWCDNCEATLFVARYADITQHFDTKLDATDEAGQEGWLELTDGRILCEVCYEGDTEK